MGVFYWVGRCGRGRAHCVVHPSDQEAAADISIRLDGSDFGGAQAPFELSVPPQQRVALLLREAGSYPLPSEPFAYSAVNSVPTGIGFWVGVQVYNGVPIVAERVAAASAASSPAGVATTTGTPVTAMRYLIAGNRSDGAEVELVVVNPSSDSIALITVSTIANGRITPIAQLDPREVAPHSRLVVPVDRLTEGASYALLVEANQPVIVSRSLLARSGTGMASGASVPFDPVLLDPSAF